MFKKIAVLIVLSAASSQAGVLRDIGHAGKQIGRQTAHMVHDVGHDLWKWIF